MWHATCLRMTPYLYSPTKLESRHVRIFQSKGRKNAYLWNGSENRKANVCSTYNSDRHANRTWHCKTETQEKQIEITADICGTVLITRRTCWQETQGGESSRWTIEIKDIWKVPEVNPVLLSQGWSAKRHGCDRRPMTWNYGTLVPIYSSLSNGAST